MLIHDEYLNLFHRLEQAQQNMVCAQYGSQKWMDSILNLKGIVLELEVFGNQVRSEYKDEFMEGVREFLKIVRENEPRLEDFLDPDVLKQIQQELADA